MIQKASEFILLGVLFTSIAAPFVISALYKFQLITTHKLMKNNMNAEFIKLHGAKNGTPTMGGIMIFLGVLLPSIIFLENTNFKFVFLAGWVLFFIYGFLDDLLTFLRRRSQKARLFDNSFVWRVFKLLSLVALSFISIYLVKANLDISSLELFYIVEIKLNIITMLLGALAFSFALYGIEITDGADGLVTGNLLIVFLGYMLVSATSYAVLLPVLSICVGAMLVYLYFNIHPARIFMSSVGTFPLGFLLLTASMLTNSLTLVIIAGIPFWIEVFSSFAQIISIRFFNKKLFRLAPFHHHLESIGWIETKVVQRFWLLGCFCLIIALYLHSLFH